MIGRGMWAAGCLFVSFLLSASSYGDSADRRATMEEQRFFRTVQELLAAALPAEVPEGWDITGQSDSEDLEFVSTETGTRPMEADYYLEWINLALQQQKEEKMLDRMSLLAEDSPISDAQVAAYEALAVKVAEAAAAGDIEAMRALQRQMEEQAAVINRALDEVDSKIVEINRATAAPDAYAVIHLFANRLQHFLEQGAERLVVAGYPAFRTKGCYTSSGEWHEGMTIVFMGKGWFAVQDDAAYQFAAAEDAVHTRLQTVVVVIEADPSRTAAIVEMIDWVSLQAALD